jgi:hemerythrin
MANAALFKWTDEYSVGIEEIDNQHKTLFDLINRLYFAALNREDATETVEILDTLLDYTRTHFALEEKLLESAGYADLAEHAQEHRRFIEKLNSVVQKFMIEEKTVTFELINFLKHWLKEHILETDTAYASALYKSGFSTDTWANHARTVITSKSHGHTPKPWWKFWEEPARQAG